MLTQERLKELLHYNPDTGIFTRLIKTSNVINIGDIAGCINKSKPNSSNRIRIRLNNKNYSAHKLAWLYVYGSWPVKCIDHIDGNSCNNAINNLRDIPQNINCQNRVKAQTNNKSGFLGVFWEKRFHVWIAKVTLNRKSIHIGSFKTPEEAHQAYLIAKRKIHEGCTI